MKSKDKLLNKKFRVSDVISSFSDVSLASFPHNWRKSHSSQFVWKDTAFYPQRFRIDLFRFLRDNLPLLNTCIWTWSRLSSAPGKYDIVGSESDDERNRALEYLENMSLRIYPFRFHRMAGMESFFPLLFNSLYTDGAFAGFLIINSDMSGIEKFRPIVPIPTIPPVCSERRRHVIPIEAVTPFRAKPPPVGAQRRGLFNYVFPFSVLVKPFRFFLIDSPFRLIL